MKKLLFIFFIFTTGMYAKAQNADSARSNKQAKTEGEIMAKVILQKYQCDTAIANTLGNLYSKRRIAFDKAYFSTNPDSAKKNQQLFVIIAKYDSLIDKFVYTASSAAFIKNKLAQLDSIKPLLPKQKSSLQNIFETLCLKRENGFADNFNDALHRVITDTIYYAKLYKDEITLQTTGNSIRVLKNLRKNNKITGAGLDILLPIIKEKERQTAIVNLTYPSFTKAKDSLLEKINANYDSLIQLTLLKDGSKLPSSQFAIAVANRKTLGLTNAQVDSLLFHSAKLKQMKDSFLLKNPYGKYDSKAFETDNITKILSEDQYTKVLQIKNKSQAETEANQDWLELQQRGLATITIRTQPYASLRISIWRNGLPIIVMAMTL